MSDHPISVASFWSVEPQQYRSSGLYASLTTMRLPCCDGGVVAGQFGGVATPKSRVVAATLCVVHTKVWVF